MSCYNKHDLRAFNDNEVDIYLKTLINDHLKECQICSRELEHIKNENIFFRRMISKLNPQEAVIPEIEVPRNKRKAKKIILHTIITTAAASVILLFVLFFPSKKDSDQIAIELLFQEYIESQDPDQLWHNKTHLYFTENEDGDLTVLSFQ